MSNLRDFTPTNSDGPRFIDEPLSLDSTRSNDAVIVDDGGLGDFHTNSEIQEEGNGRNKLFAGLAVAVLVGIGGAYAFSTMNNTAPANVVADAKPVAPKVAAMTPPPAPAPQAVTPTPEATAPAAADVAKPAPVTKQAAARIAPMPKSSSTTTSTAANIPAPVESTPAITPAPAQNQAANTVPDPVSPTPPAAALAGNPALNQQSVEPAPAPVDAAPAPQAAAPAPVEAAPAAPAPVEAAPAAPATPAQ